MISARKVLLAGIIAAATSSFSFAVDATQTGGSSPAAAATATKPADPKIQALIDKLADADPTVRDSATQELQKIGRDALPQLKEQADSENPELRGRVRSLIRHAERRLPPAAPPHDGGGWSHSTRMSISNGKKTIDVDDNGYKIRIRQDEQGIQMDVTGVENGKEVTENYTAKDADQLKRDNPEAFTLYDKYNNGAGGGLHIIGGGVQGNVQIQIQGGGAAGGGVWVGGNGGGFGPGGFRRGMRPPNEPQQPLSDEAKKKIEEQLKQQNVPEEQQRLMREYLERIQRQQQDVQDQVQRQLEQEQRKALDNLKVPDRVEKKDEKTEKKSEEKTTEKKEAK